MATVAVPRQAAPATGWHYKQRPAAAGRQVAATYTEIVHRPKRRIAPTSISSMAGSERIDEVRGDDELWLWRTRTSEPGPPVKFKKS
jgi:hypothetical protein